MCTVAGSHGAGINRIKSSEEFQSLFYLVYSDGRDAGLSRGVVGNAERIAGSSGERAAAATGLSQRGKRQQRIDFRNFKTKNKRHSWSSCSCAYT